MNAIRLYFRLIQISILSRMQYRANFIVGILGLLFWNVINLGLIGVLVTRFTSLKDWTLWEVVFLYSLWILGYSVYGLFFSHTEALENYLVEGSFDQFLLRPASPLIQLLGREFQHNEIANVFIGLTGISLAYTRLDLHWDGWKWGFLIAAVVSAGIIVLAINLLIACTGFWTGRSRGTMIIMHQFYYLVQQYPIDIFGTAFRVLVTGLIPVAFMNYYPSQMLLGKLDPGSPWGWLGYMSPVVALTLAIITSRVWHLALRHYSSSGG